MLVNQKLPTAHIFTFIGNIFFLEKVYKINALNKIDLEILKGISLAKRRICQECVVVFLSNLSQSHFFVCTDTLFF